MNKTHIAIAAVAAIGAVALYAWKRRVDTRQQARNEAAGPRLPSLPSLPPLPAVSGAVPNMPKMPDMPRMPTMGAW